MTTRDQTDVVLDIAREAESRYYGKYRGFVVDNEDPEQRARLRVKVPTVLGDQTTAWALPCLPFGGSPDSGLILLPEVHAEIWVEFEMGDPHLPVWVGTLYTQAPQSGGDRDLGPWQRRTLRTAGGQVLRLDDTGGSTGILIRHQSGAEITIGDDGTITAKDDKGETITLDASGRVLVEDGNGNSIKLTRSGIAATDSAGNSVELAGAGVTVKGTTVTVDAQSVMLGGSGGEPVLKGSTFLAAYMAHTHGTVTGPSTPPIPTSEATALSTTVLTR